MSGESVLVVEDEWVVAKDLERRLESLCYTVAGHAATAEEAIELIERRRPDVVLMDVRLGGAMDGVEAARVISERWALPVVFVTAYADAQFVDRARAALPRGCVHKPFDSRTLFTAIEFALEGHRRAGDAGVHAQRLAEVLALLPQCLLLTDDEGCIVASSAAADRLFSRVAGGLVGRPIEDCFGPGVRFAPEALEGRGAVRQTLDPAVAELSAALVRVNRLGPPEASGRGWAVSLEPELDGGDGPTPSAAPTDEPAEVVALDVAPPEETSEVLQRRAEQRRASAALESIPVCGRSEFRRVNLSRLAREVAHDLAAEPGGRLFRVQTEEQCVAWCDERAMRRVLHMLLDVARASTLRLPNASVRFGQRVARDRTLFFIYDNGVGSDPARLEFYEGAPERADGRTGWKVVEDAIAAHGGALGRKLDDAGRGVTVFFTLPRGAGET